MLPKVLASRSSEALCVITKVDLEKCVIVKVDLKKCVITKVDLKKCIMTKVDLEKWRKQGLPTHCVHPHIWDLVIDICTQFLLCNEDTNNILMFEDVSMYISIISCLT
jgi:hypothetical protein